MVNVKYAVEFKDQGFTFVALSPGLGMFRFWLCIPFL